MSEKTFRQLDETFEHFLDSVQIEHAEKELTPKLKAARRKKCDNDAFAFCKEYFPAIFRDCFNPLHIHINSLTEGINAVSGSRRFGKSAFGYITKLVKPMCVGGLGLLGLGLRTQDDASERTAALMRLVRRNKKLMYDYNINFQQDKKGDYIVNNKQLVSFGFREGLRNIFDEEFNRFETIILDDLFNRISVTSEVENDKIYNFVTSECTGQLKPKGLLIWFFNYITSYSPGAKFASEKPAQHYNLPALDENGETNWKGATEMTTEELNRIKQTLSFDVWMGDYMNDPIQKGEVFDVDWLRTINISLIKFVAVLTAVDPSHGKSPEACFKGVITMGLTDESSLILLDTYIRKENYLNMFDYIDNQRAKYSMFRAVLFENDFNQWFAAEPYYTAWSDKRNKHLPIVVYSAKILKTDVYGSDKDSRIMNLVFPFQMGNILINEQLYNASTKTALTSDFKLWLNQYIQFGKHKEKLDGLDATATAFIMLPRYKVTGAFKSLGQRKQKDEWLHGR